MLPSYLWLAVALACPLASARPSGCDTSVIGDAAACKQPQLASRGLGEWLEYRNPANGKLYEERPEKSRWNPLNWFGGTPESEQGEQPQQPKRISGSSGSTQSTQIPRGSAQNPSSAGVTEVNQGNVPAVEGADRVPSPVAGMDRASSGQSISP